MELTRSERAKITDGVHSVQSAQASLADVEGGKIPKIDEIQECLKGADKHLRMILRQTPSKKPK